VKSLAEARKPGGPPLLLGGTGGRLDGDRHRAADASAPLGSNVKIVSGYPDSNSINLAIGARRGGGPFSSALSAIAATQAGLAGAGQLHSAIPAIRARRRASSAISSTFRPRAGDRA